MGSDVAVSAEVSTSTRYETPGVNGKRGVNRMPLPFVTAYRPMMAGARGWSTYTASTRGQAESLGASLPTVRMVTRESPVTSTACSGPVVTVAILIFATGSAQAKLKIVIPSGAA